MDSLQIFKFNEVSQTNYIAGIDGGMDSCSHKNSSSEPLSSNFLKAHLLFIT